MQERTYTFRRIVSLMLALVMVVGMFPALRVLATTVTVLDGQVSVTDTANTLSGNATKMTATAKGSLLSKKNNTITITNNSEVKAEISVGYSVASANSFTIDGASADASGTITKQLDAGGTIVFYIQSKSGVSDLTVTLTLSNLTIREVKESSDVTFQYDNTLGSITVAGTAVAPGGTVNINGTSGVALVATTMNGSKFLGWTDGEGKILSTQTSYALTPADDMTVKAAFAKDGGTPWFGVGSAAQQSANTGLLGLSKLYYYTVGTTYLFDDLNAAASYASTSSNKTIVLMNSGTLGAGNYTIPAGVTLLIPFDAANTMYTTQVQNTGTYTEPTAYRTLTMADGANLIINGAMSVSAKQMYASGAADLNPYGSAPTGPVGFVQMQGSSNITVNNGGSLYAYGFITGSGTVTANSGAQVYEMFQFSDFRGGSQSTDMGNGVFPLSQYYVQNIEVPMTLYAGAKEYAYTTIYMSSADFGSAVAFIANSGAMFNLTSGYVVKEYDGAKDRLIVELAGNMTISPVNLSVGTSSINSKDYDLGINGNITLTVRGGSNVTISQDVALLPGSEIVVEEGATCTLASGINVYVYDADQWGTYCSPSNKKLIPVAYAPGRTKTRTEADLVDAKVVVNGIMDASKGYVYTTANGANIISTGSGVVKVNPGTLTVTYQLIQGNDSVPDVYPEIPINPAKLKNADGTYLETANGGENTYVYRDGKWVCDVGEGCDGHHTPTDTSNVTKEPTCTEDGTRAHTCKVCGTSYTEVIPATGHSFNEVVAANPATCLAAGNDAYKQCTVCNKYFAADATLDSTDGKDTTDDFVIAQKDHSYTGTIKSDGNGKDATHSFQCVNGCEQYGGAVQHTWNEGEETTAPECEAEGMKTFTCTNEGCGATYTETISATGHSYSTDWKSDETNHWHECVCGEKADEAAHSDVDTDQNHNCDVCGKENVTSHSYEPKITEPTFDADGYTVYTCDCGYSYTETDEGSKKTAVAMIGEERYESLAEAVATAKDGDTVKILKDISLDQTITVSGKAVTIRADNPVTITTGTPDVFTVTSDGELTLGANVTVNSSTSILWANGGTINVDGATLNATNSPYAVVFADKNGQINIKSGAVNASGSNVVTVSASGAVINISGGEVTNASSSAVVAKDNGTVNISGGTVKTTDTSDNYYCAAFARNGGTISVSGGEVSAANGYGLVAVTGGKVTVSGGTVSGVAAHENANAVAVISGGYVSGNVYANNGATVTVTGGSFDVDVTTFCDADHHTVYSYEDGTYTYGKHSWTVDKYEWSEDGKSCTAHCKCACGATTTVDGSISSEEKTPATCTEKGWTTYTATFEAGWATAQTKDVQDIPTIEHTFSAEWKTDETNHWHECACGEKSEVVAHTDENPKDHNCDTCGYVMSVCEDGDDADHKCDYCGADNITQHVFGDEWKYNNTDHWHECACGEKNAVAAHSYEPKKTEPTFDADGYTTYTCTCDHSYTVTDEGTQKTAVASIGTVKYESLAEAVAAANDGDTVKILMDINLDQVIIVADKAVIITADNPVTITTGTTDVFTVTSGGELTLGANVTVNSTTSILWANGGTINLDGATLIATNSPYAAVFADDGGEINIKSGAVHASGSDSVTVTASGAVINISGGEVVSDSSSAVLAKDSGTVNISGGKVETTATDNYCAAYARNGGVVNVTGGEVSAAAGYGLVAVASGKVTVSGGTVSGVAAHENANAVAVISGGYINGSVYANNGATLTVTGGRFIMDVTEYCAEGFHTVDSDADGIYTYGAHSYGTEWTTDETNHWHECVCGAKSGEAAHADEATKDHKCDVCGKDMHMQLGDLDLDGDVDAQDLTLLARHVGGIEYITDLQALKNADINGDGEIDANDLTIHARYIGGIISDWSEDLGADDGEDPEPENP